MTTLRQRKDKPHWEKMFIIHIYNKQFGSGVPYKSIVTIYKLREKWGKGFSRHFIKEIIRSCETKIMSDSGKVVLIVQMGIVFDLLESPQENRAIKIAQIKTHGQQICRTRYPLSLQNVSGWKETKHHPPPDQWGVCICAEIQGKRWGDWWRRLGTSFLRKLPKEPTRGWLSAYQSTGEIWKLGLVRSLNTYLQKN